jgi:hypothetical protein
MHVYVNVFGWILKLECARKPSPFLIVPGLWQWQATGGQINSPIKHNGHCPINNNLRSWLWKKYREEFHYFPARQSQQLD